MTSLKIVPTAKSTTKNNNSWFHCQSVHFTYNHEITQESGKTENAIEPLSREKYHHHKKIPETTCDEWHLTRSIKQLHSQGTLKIENSAKHGRNQRKIHWKRKRNSHRKKGLDRSNVSGHGSQKISKNVAFSAFLTLAYLWRQCKKVDSIRFRESPALFTLSVYRSLKLTFPWDTGGLSLDGSLKRKRERWTLCQWYKPSVSSPLTCLMHIPNANRTDHVFLVNLYKWRRPEVSDSQSESRSQFPVSGCWCMMCTRDPVFQLRPWIHTVREFFPSTQHGLKYAQEVFPG